MKIIWVLCQYHAQGRFDELENMIHGDDGAGPAAEQTRGWHAVNLEQCCVSPMSRADMPLIRG